MLRWAVTIAVLALCAAPARADEAVARQAMQQGVAAMAAGDAARALPAFERAIAEVPDAPVPHRYLGEALEQLGRWDEAVAAYQLYLKLRPDSRDAADVLARIERIAARQRGELAIHCTPTGADIEVDGTPAGAAPVDGLRLAAGAHTVHVTATGYLARNLAVNVVGGERTVVDCALDKLPPPSPREPSPGTSEPVVRQPSGPTPPALAPKRHGKAWYRRPWVWAAAGAAVVAGGVGVYLVLPDRPDTSGGDIHFPP